MQGLPGPKSDCSGVFPPGGSSCGLTGASASPGGEGMHVPLECCDPLDDQYDSGFQGSCLGCGCLYG